MRALVVLALLLPLASSTISVNVREGQGGVLVTIAAGEPPIKVAVDEGVLIKAVDARLVDGTVVSDNVVTLVIKKLPARLRVEHGPYTGLLVINGVGDCRYAEAALSRDKISVRAFTCSEPFPLVIELRGATPVQATLIYECALWKKKVFVVKVCEEEACAFKAKVGPLRCVERREVVERDLRCAETQQEKCTSFIVTERSVLRCLKWEAEEVCLWKACAKWGYEPVELRYCEKEVPTLLETPVKVAGNLVAVNVTRYVSFTVPYVADERVAAVLYVSGHPLPLVNEAPSPAPFLNVVLLALLAVAVLVAVIA
ncbi:MAG: hypothetical protein GXO07_06405 [Crenarchaeota archaeon]|nr:hypothetical protein [Thermoproteota archaeon]